MRAGVRHAVSFGTSPKKGTKRRNLMLLMLRPQGVSSVELLEMGVNSSTIGPNISYIRDLLGWDVFSKRHSEKVNGKVVYTYKIIGKMKWDGTYRSFVSV